MIRMVRKYFKNLFRKENKDLVRRRLTNVEAEEISIAMKAMCEKYFKNKIEENIDTWLLNEYSDKSVVTCHAITDLAQFLIQLFGMKSNSSDGFKSGPEIRGEEFVSSLHWFSWPKFENIIEFPEFKILINYIWEERYLLDKSKSVLEHIFEIEKQKVSQNPEYFRKMFAEMYKRCRK